ncbi:MAG: c-type cytochrome [Thermoanaerobaculia bacterium]
MRKRSLPSLAGTVRVLCVGLLLPLPLQAEFGDPMPGQSLFVSKRCVECHAIRGAGGRIGPDLGRTAVKGSFYEIAAALWNHSLVMGDKMKEFRIVRPTFRENELADLLAFLYFLNYFDEPGDPEVGKVLFAQKHCIQCHGLGRQGGAAGPRLDTLPRGSSPLRIAQDLWNHGPAMVPAIRRQGLDIPKFNGSEIIDLFAYLRSQGQQRQAAREFRSAGDPGRGKRLFREKGCSRCHSVLGGGAEIGPDLGKAELRGSVTQLAGRMWNHWPAMVEAMSALGMSPPIFKGEDVADVFAYLFVSRYDGRPGDLSRGRTVYRQKGCVVCHGENGEGASGPALRGLSGESKEQIAQRMWNHAPQMRERMGTQQIPWPRLDPEELSALLAVVADGWKSPVPERSSESTEPKRRKSP